MLFNSYSFFIFLMIVVLIFRVLRHQKLVKNASKYWLLLCSYAFYSFWDWRFCILLLGSTVLDFVVGRQMARLNKRPNNTTRRTLLLMVSLMGNLGVLFFFKYFSLIAHGLSLAALLTAPLTAWSSALTSLEIVLPIGISFYTFQTLSYTIDIYRKKIEPTSSFTDFALFVAFFPQLVAGPVERAKTLLPQISAIGRAKEIKSKSYQEAFAFVTIGLALKLLIGDSAAAVVDRVFAAPEAFSATELSIAPILFLLQVYGDFAGYSLIARGVAKLFGVELMQNFRQPLLSTNFTDFWRRWHISLYAWFREYLYLPLGGSRKGWLHTYFNIILIMTLAGFWHGAGWHFAVWGLVNGILLVGDRWLGQHQLRLPKHSYWQPIKILLTVVLFSATLPLFRSPDLASSWQYFKLIFIQIQLGNFELSSRIGWFALLGISMTYLLDINQQYQQRGANFIFDIASLYRIPILAAIWFFLLLRLIAFTPKPFVYFQF